MFAVEVVVFQRPGNGVGDGKQQPFVAKHGVLAAYALELGDHVAHVDAGAQSQGNQAADGFGLGGDGVPGLAYGGKNLKGAALHFIDGKVHGAEARGHFLGEAPEDVGPTAHARAQRGGGGLLRQGLRFAGGIRARIRSLGRALILFHGLLPFAGGEHLHAFAAVAVDGDALAAFLVGQPVNVKNILFRGLVGQVHGLGHGVVRVALEGGLHAQMPDWGHIHGRDKDAAQIFGQKIHVLHGTLGGHGFHDFRAAHAGLGQGGLKVGIHLQQTFAVQDIAGEAEGEQGFHTRGAARNDGEGARGRDGGNRGVAVGACLSGGVDRAAVGREGAAFLRQLGRGLVPFFLDKGHEAFAQGQALRRVVGHVQLKKQVGKAHDAQADFAVFSYGFCNNFQREA